MTGLTDWAPNAHALVVHLPIGLLVTAFAAELATLLRSRPEPVATVSTALYAAGWLTLAAAYLTGRAAAPEVYTPGLAVPVVDRHWTLALWCLLYFGALTAGRLWVLGVPGRPARAGGTGGTSEPGSRAGQVGQVKGPARAGGAGGTSEGQAATRRGAAHLAFGAAGLAGLLLLAATAELGGRLVYQYGVGVAAPLAE